MKKALICSAFAAAIVFSGFAQSEKDGQPKTNPDASMMQVAGQLVKYGYQKGEALPLIQAVEIYQRIGGTEKQSAKTTETNESSTTAETSENQEKVSSVSYDINQLLADATELSDGNANLLGLIDNLKNSATRGATKNYDVHVDRVNAHSTDTYNIRFFGGEEAIVVVSGDGDTDLDLEIYDSNGNLVASDMDYTDDCVCVWTPRWTGNFTIKIINRGNVYNKYRMAIN